MLVAYLTILILATSLQHGLSSLQECPSTFIRNRTMSESPNLPNEKGLRIVKHFSNDGVELAGITNGFTRSTQPLKDFGTQRILVLLLWRPSYVKPCILVWFGNDVKVDVVDRLVRHPSVVLCGV